MDPISFVFSAYVDAVQNIVHKKMTDSFGTEVKAVVIDYQAVSIPFQYQMWRVKDKTVCLPYQSDLSRYSHCTLTAKRLFAELCTQLSKKPSAHWRHTKTKDMYCNAAVTYQPTIARVSEASAMDKAEKAKAECNLAIAAALGSRDPAVIIERDRVCGD